VSLAERFLVPSAAPLLLVPPLAWLLLLARDRVRARRAADVLGPRAPVLSDVTPGRRRASRALWAAALLLAVVALLQPLWGAGGQDAAPRGVDLVVCLDVSRSMLARDVEPSRIAAARAEIRSLAERASGDRIALVVFAGDAHLVAPLTHDLAAIAQLADLADTLSVERGGTDVGAALECALGALEAATGDHEAILLLSDGEDLGQRSLRAAEHCKARGVPVHSIGFGSERGSKVPVEGDGGETFLRDRAGREVVSALDTGALRAIADATGGTFAGVGQGSAVLPGLYEARILPAARESRDARADRANRFQWPLFAALAAWIASLAASPRRRP
jgi:Ca-activated chloride channel family protein